jgi:acetylornithine deacetylase/succinyl-diaminopimelate desuccinylase-like protein
MTSLHENLAAARPQQLDALKEWLRIPSVSTLPEHKDDVRAAAQWLVSFLQQAGLAQVEIIETPGHPIVYAEWMQAGPQAPTVLIYGHYDVQPVDPVEKWETPPFEPTIKSGPDGDRLYARGASDDKGQIFVHVAAVAALLQNRGSLPVNVKFLIEGEEEVGSKALMEYVPAHAAKLAADVCLVSDTHILSPSQPSIIYGLRGMWAGELTVRGPRRDLHSGAYGGAIHNPNQELCELIAALHDKNGSVTVPGFYDQVRTIGAEERAKLREVPYSAEDVRKETGVPALYGEAGYTVVEQIGARPTLEINGMWGGFTGAGFKTVIPAEAYAKISCRLVPDQDPSQIGPMIEAFLQEIAPDTVEVSLKTLQHAPATLVDLDVPQMQAAVRAYERSFGATPVFTREGGSIPVATTLQQSLNAPVIFMGFGLPDDNLHAPNEKFHLPNFYRGIEASIAFLEEVGSLKGEV